FATLEGGMQEKYSKGFNEAEILKPFHNKAGAYGLFGIKRIAVEDVNKNYHYFFNDGKKSYSMIDLNNLEKSEEIAINELKINYERIKKHYKRNGKTSSGINDELLAILSYNYGITNLLKDLGKNGNMETVINSMFETYLTNRDSSSNPPQELSYPFLIVDYANGFREAIERDNVLSSDVKKEIKESKSNKSYKSNKISGNNKSYNDYKSYNNDKSYWLFDGLCKYNPKEEFDKVDLSKINEEIRGYYKANKNPFPPQ
ncbi:MAG: transglycosylase SLT domain-containing protein, partial [Nitrospiraceae bacterium]|nr:transglycosylase SLT domain-containing protein [Nitrospiraceae bacterium]